MGDLKREERQRRGLHPSPFLAVVKAAGIPAPRLVAARPLQPDQKIPHEVIPDVVLVSLEAVQSERREEVIPQRAELTAIPRRRVRGEESPPALERTLGVSLQRARIRPTVIATGGVGGLS